jgi:hypothetical protein
VEKMASPFASSIFTQHEFVFELPTGESHRGDRGNLTVQTTPTKVRFYLKKASSFGQLLGSKVDEVATHKAYVTAVGGDRNMIMVGLRAGMVGTITGTGDKTIKILGEAEESIAPLTKTWGKVYSVMISDRSVLGNSL